MNVSSLIGAAVVYQGQPAEIARILTRWQLADGRSGLRVVLYVPARAELVRAMVCTSGGELAVVDDAPELDVAVLDARPQYERTGGAA